MYTTDQIRQYHRITWIFPCDLWNSVRKVTFRGKGISWSNVSNDHWKEVLYMFVLQNIIWQKIETTSCCLRRPCIENKTSSIIISIVQWYQHWIQKLTLSLCRSSTNLSICVWVIRSLIFLLSRISSITMCTALSPIKPWNRENQAVMKFRWVLADQLIKHFNWIPELLIY